jgi:hypothetical protein
MAPRQGQVVHAWRVPKMWRGRYGTDNLSADGQEWCSTQFPDGLGENT